MAGHLQHWFEVASLRCATPTTLTHCIQYFSPGLKWFSLLTKVSNTRLLSFVIFCQLSKSWNLSKFFNHQCDFFPTISTGNDGFGACRIYCTGYAKYWNGPPFLNSGFPLYIFSKRFSLNEFLFSRKPCEYCRLFRQKAWFKMGTGWDKAWGGKPDETSCSKTRTHSVQTVPALAPGTYRQWLKTTLRSRGGEGQHRDAQVLCC